MVCILSCVSQNNSLSFKAANRAANVFLVYNKTMKSFTLREMDVYLINGRRSSSLALFRKLAEGRGVEEVCYFQGA